MIVDRIEIIIEERNNTWINIRCSRVNQNVTLRLSICQNKEEKGITNNQKGLTSLSSPHGRERNKGTSGGRLFHFHKMIETERTMHNPTIRFVRENIQFWF